MLRFVNSQTNMVCVKLQTFLNGPYMHQQLIH